ncbi:MAG: hypothetical protein AB1497_06905 [Bacillota bacterium]
MNCLKDSAREFRASAAPTTKALPVSAEMDCQRRFVRFELFLPLGVMSRQKLSEVATDLKRMKGEQLASLLLETLSRGRSGLKVVLESLQDEKNGGKIARGLSELGARAVEALARQPEALESPGATLILQHIDTGHIEGRVSEFLRRGDCRAARLLASMLLARAPGNATASVARAVCASPEERDNAYAEALAAIGDNKDLARTLGEAALAVALFATAWRCARIVGLSDAAFGERVLEYILMGAGEPSLLDELAGEIRRQDAVATELLGRVMSRASRSGEQFLVSVGRRCEAVAAAVGRLETSNAELLGGSMAAGEAIRRSIEHWKAVKEAVANLKNTAWEYGFKKDKVSQEILWLGALDGFPGVPVKGEFPQDEVEVPVEVTYSAIAELLRSHGDPVQVLGKVSHVCIVPWQPCTTAYEPLLRIMASSGGHLWGGEGALNVDFRGRREDGRAVGLQAGAGLSGEVRSDQEFACSLLLEYRQGRERSAQQHAQIVWEVADSMLQLAGSAGDALEKVGHGASLSATCRQVATDSLGIRARAEALKVYAELSQQISASSLDPREMLESIIGSMCLSLRAKGVQSMLKLDPEMPEVLLDRQKIRGVVSGVLYHVASLSSRLMEVHASYAKDSGQVCITVNSDGNIEEPEMFDLLKSAVERNGGELSMDTLGRIRLRLPSNAADVPLSALIQGFHRLQEDTKKALRTAWSLKELPGQEELVEFLVRKAVEVEVEARLRGQLPRHRLLPRALAVQNIAAGAERYYPGRPPQEIRERVIAVAKAVEKDRVDRVIRDLRNGGCLFWLADIPPEDTIVALSDALYKIGGADAASIWTHAQTALSLLVGIKFE